MKYFVVASFSKISSILGRGFLFILFLRSLKFCAELGDIELEIMSAASKSSNSFFMISRSLKDLRYAGINVTDSSIIVILCTPTVLRPNSLHFETFTDESCSLS